MMSWTSRRHLLLDCCRVVRFAYTRAHGTRAIRVVQTTHPQPPSGFCLAQHGPQHLCHARATVQVEVLRRLIHLSLDLA